MRSGLNDKGYPKVLPQVTPKPWYPLVAWVKEHEQAMADIRPRQRPNVRTIVPLDELRLPRRAYFDWQTMPLRELAVYMPNQVRHMIRADSTLDRVEARERGELPTLPAWRPLRDLVSDPNGPWKLPDLSGSYKKYVKPSPPPASLVDKGPADGVSLMTATILITAVAFFSCCVSFVIYNRSKLKKERARRQSREWPMPDVIATRHINGREGNMTPMDPSGAFLAANPTPLSIDQPPTYSECVKQTVEMKPEGREVPPPPYSTCYVSFSDTEDGVPSVHFFNNPRARNENERSGFENNVHNVRQTMAARRETAGCNNLMFDNGRVMEIFSNGVNGNNARYMGRSADVTNGNDLATSSAERMRFIST